MTKLKPFFSYYGGKYRIAKFYLKPLYDTIIEPFCGSAGYSLNYSNLKIKLYDVSDFICGLWSYLIKVKESEILLLPNEIIHLDCIQLLQEQKWLIGFWLNKGNTGPCKQPSKWMREQTRVN